MALAGLRSVDARRKVAAEVFSGQLGSSVKYLPLRMSKLGDNITVRWQVIICKTISVRNQVVPSQNIEWADYSSLKYNFLEFLHWIHCAINCLEQSYNYLDELLKVHI